MLIHLKKAGCSRTTLMATIHLIENYLTYNFTTREITILLYLAGHSYQKIYDRYRSWSIDNFADNGIEPRYNPGLGQKLTLVDNHPRDGHE